MNSFVDPILFKNLVKNSQKVILADGGANQFYKTIKDPSSVDWIVGDFDSISQDVLDYYKK